MKLVPGKCAFAAPLVALLALLSGCGKSGPATGKIEGRITYDGQPVTEGNVIFENSEQGLLAVAPLDGQGQYRMPAVKLAEYLVYVKPIEPKLPDETSGAGTISTPRNAGVDPANIPHPYRTSQTTPLKATVKEGTNPFDFDLAKSTSNE
jgi:hypothetical protein